MSAVGGPVTIGVDAVSGTAEAIPLPDRSVDGLTVAQAFHWFRPEAALRVRNSGGTSLPAGLATLYQRLPDGGLSFLGDARLRQEVEQGVAAAQLQLRELGWGRLEHRGRCLRGRRRHRGPVLRASRG